MTQRVESMISLARRGSSRYDADEVREAVDFLAWLLRGNFVLLGAREYEIKDEAYRCIPGSGLGILADEERSAYSTPVPLKDLPEALRNLALGGELLIVDKANARAPGPPARADGLRRRPPRHGRRRAGRRGAPARPVHDQGLSGGRRPRPRSCTASCGACSRPRT